MALQKIITQDKDILLVQNNVEAALIPLQNAPLTGGQILLNITLVAGIDNLIPHTLGFAPTLIIFSASNVQTILWSPETTALSGTNKSSKKINVWCTANCVASIWVG